MSNRKSLSDEVFECITGTSYASIINNQANTYCLYIGFAMSCVYTVALDEHFQTVDFVLKRAESRRHTLKSLCFDDVRAKCEPDFSAARPTRKCVCGKTPHKTASLCPKVCTDFKWKNKLLALACTYAVNHLITIKILHIQFNLIS